MSITAERLRTLFNYDPETGLFIRKVRTGTKTRVGEPAGGVNAIGYVFISIDGKRRLAHRLAWLFMTGEMPPQLIDHINECRSDNRWCNLRAADNAQNLWNRGASAANKSGFKGVSFDRKTGRWKAAIKARNKYKFLGRFATPEEAHAAYAAAANDLHREFANPGVAA